MSIVSDEYYARGYEKARANDVDGALRAYTKAVAIDPGRAEYHYARGLCVLHLPYPDYFIVFDEFKEAIRLAPHNATYDYALGVTYFEKRKLQNALYYVESAIEKLGNYPVNQRLEMSDALQAKAIILCAMGQYGKALDFIRESRLYRKSPCS